ncbi:MAG: insulinase family protein [Myxococcales bacterium]|nr:insulinase family protein [Myxococcales bacterium]
MSSRAVVTALVGALVACGHAPTPSSRSPSGRAALAVGELSVVVVPTASEGLVRASLWIDAGTRDGGAAATLAAWALRRDGLEARATPDALELSVRGEAGELDAMLRALAEALSTRALEPSSHAALRAQLDDARRRAAAHPTLRADALALRATLGTDPFTGDPSREDVEAFFATHFGPSRALLVVVGDASEREVERSAAAAFRRAPAARSTRSHAMRSVARPEGLVGDAEAWAAVLQEEGTRFAATVALTVAEVDEAWAIARALRVGGSTVFPHREGVTVLSRVDSPAAVPALVTRARLLEVPGRRPPEPSGIDAVAERTALEWLGRTGIPRRRLVVGWVGPRSNDTRSNDTRSNDTRSNDTRSNDTRSNDTRSNDQARLVERPQIRRGSAGEVAHATTAGGARAFATRRDGATALALRFRTGGVEPARAQLLAAALASRCDAPAPVVPHVDEDGFALVVRTSDERWREAADALVRCASAEPGRTEGPRLRLLAERRATPERGWIARALAPGAHGVIEPRGTEGELSGPLPLARFAEETRVGARASFAIVGPVDAGEAAEHLALLLSWLPPGDPASAPRWGEPLPLGGRDWRGERARVVVGWRVEGGEVGRELVARAFAAESAAILGRVGDVLWHDGGRSERGAWAAVAVELPVDRLDAFDAARRAVRPPSPAVLGRVLDEARWASSDPLVAALRLARDGSPRAPLPSAEGIEAIGSGLARAEPAIVIGRPPRR